MRSNVSTFLFGILFMSLIASCGGSSDEDSSGYPFGSSSDYAPSSLRGKTLMAEDVTTPLVFTSATHVDMPDLQDPGEVWTGPSYTYRKTSSTTGSLSVEYSVSDRGSSEVDDYAFDLTLVFTAAGVGHMTGTATATRDLGGGLSEREHGTIDSDFTLE